MSNSDPGVLAPPEALVQPDAPAQPPAQPAARPPARPLVEPLASRWRKWYVLAVLILIGLFNYIDRQSLAILQIPIKRELGLSDTELGALTGLAFAFLYTFMGLPIARLADRSNRKWLIAVALGVWSLMTAASGLAVGMITLVITRMGVAVGEAACAPTSHSLISDYFRREQRATAIGLWMLTFPIGTMLGFVAGGWLTTAFGWREAFAVLGLCGLALVPLVLLTVREPQRGAMDSALASGQQPSLATALRTLWSLRAFRHATLAGALVDYALYATLNWNAPFYNRVFGLSMHEIGAHLALLSGIGGGLGVYLGGALTDRLGRRDARWYMWVPAIAALAAVPIMMIQYFTTLPRLSLLAGYLPALCLSSFLAPLVATGQMLVPATLRAFTSAVLALAVNIIGLGLGPLVTGILSDLLVTHYHLGNDSLRYAIAASAVIAVWGAAHFLRAAFFLRQELTAVQSGSAI
jgi:MFS family permease